MFKNTRTVESSNNTKRTVSKDDNSFEKYSVMVSSIIFAARSFGKPKMPVEMAGKVIDFRASSLPDLRRIIFGEQVQKLE